MRMSLIHPHGSVNLQNRIGSLAQQSCKTYNIHNIDNIDNTYNAL